MKHSDKAVEYFNQNFNCSQGVFASFAVEHGIDEKLALKLGTNFGGGARKGEMCGAVSGALMVLGLLYGHCDSTDLETKSKAYAISEEFINRFIQKNGTVVCRELLGYDLTNPEELEEIRKQGLFQSLCPRMVQSSADILDELLKELDGYGTDGVEKRH